MGKNVFDYLETAFKRIFSHDGTQRIKSVLIVGICFSFAQIILFAGAAVVIGGLYVYDALVSSVMFLITGIICMIYGVLALSILIIESSFYAVLLPKFFSDSHQQYNIQTGIDLWKQYFWKYVIYLNYYSLIILGLVIAFSTIGFLLFLIEASALIIFTTSILSIGALVYVCTRLTLGWHSIFFLPVQNTNYLTNSWKILRGKVWKTFLMSCVFFFIVSTGAGVSTYLTQLFTPDIYTALASQVEGLLDLPDPPSRQSLETVIMPFIIPILYSCIVFTIIRKVAHIYTEAMRHAFLMQYYQDLSNAEITQEKEVK